MNEIDIVVKARNDTKRVFDQVRTDGAKLGDEVGLDITKRITQKLSIVRSDSGLAAAGDGIGQTIGERVRQRISERVKVAFDRIRIDQQHVDVDVHDRQHVKVDVDVDEKSTLAKVASLGTRIGDSLSDKLSSGLSGFFSGDLISLIVKGISVTAIVAALAPVLGAGIAGAILLALGGGVIAAGVAAALKDPEIQAALSGLKDRAAEVFATFGANFKNPMANFLEGLGRVLTQVTPMIESLGARFAPVVDRLGTGFVAFLQNALPGILRAAEKSAPLFEMLADKLPSLGDEIGRFFDHIGNSAPEATLFLGDLLDVVRLTIKAVGNLIEILARFYTVVRTVTTGAIALFLGMFSAILRAAALAFGWIPGIGPKLRTAVGQFEDFKNNVNSKLNKIRDKTVQVTIRQVYTTVGNAAVDVAGILGGRASGGVQGAATGGARSGLTWVGEHGPELVRMPAGSAVMSNPDSMRAAAAGGGSGVTQLVASLAPGASDAPLLRELMKLLRLEIRADGGNVQQVLGTA